MHTAGTSQRTLTCKLVAKRTSTNTYLQKVQILALTILFSFVGKIKQADPGFEPGSPDSKSGVITTTLIRPIG